MRSFGPQMNNTPGAFPQMLTALNAALSKPLQIIIAGDPSAPETFAMLKEVHNRSCRLPTNDVKEMGKLLDQESPS